MTSRGQSSSQDPSAAGVAAVADIIDRHRPASRRLRRLVAILTEQPHDLATLVRLTALPRQTVQSVLAAADHDLLSDGAAVAIQPARVPAYRERFGYDELMRTELTDPLAGRLATAAPVVAKIADLTARVPAARADLDHVPATPETVVRRALWLDSTYDLTAMTLLCVGDHDLTSLAVAQVSPDATVVVVDIDEPTLEFVDSQASALGLAVRCFAADMRFGLPQPAIGCADLVFTDPPYTPEGVGLFVARGLQGLANRDNGRVIAAYGYSERHPTLGLQVQAVVPRLGLAYEAVLPAFNRYDGGEAVGSASDLYVWRPTARTWRGLDRFLASTGINIYTRGVHALEKNEAAGGTLPPAVHRAATAGDLPIGAAVGDGWPDAGRGAGTARMGLGTLLSGGIQRGMARRGPFAVVADLSADPGPWLFRLLLAVNADRVVALVPSEHPDVRNEAAQRSLTGLVRPKYKVRFLRSQPDSTHTIVVADAVEPDQLDAAGRLAQRLLRRAHGKVGNVWQEGLISARREHGGDQLTKHDARAMVTARARRAHVLDAPLMALPRHEIAQVLADAAVSAEPAVSPER